jgi:hypothetical protein
MFHRLIAAAGAALLAVSLAAAAAEAGRAPSAVGAQAFAGPYLGSYSARLTLAQATARGDSRMAGRFTLVLRANGTYTASNPLDGTMRGRLTALPGQRLRFSRDSGCLFGGFERPNGGIYRWSLSGRRLTLRLVTEGACTGRTQTLTYPVWLRR